MSFVANKSVSVLGAVSSQYVVEHPQLADANNGNPLTQGNRNAHIEAVNMTAGVVFLAFDRVVVPPSGNGVQGAINTAQYSRTGPMAATPGDFDFAITTGSGWGAIDIAIPYGSKYVSVYTVAAGNVVISYGNQL